MRKSDLVLLKYDEVKLHFKIFRRDGSDVATIESKEKDLVKAVEKR
jgi:hypothetical protein